MSPSGDGAERHGNGFTGSTWKLYAILQDRRVVTQRECCTILVRPCILDILSTVVVFPTRHSNALITRIFGVGVRYGGRWRGGYCTTTALYIRTSYYKASGSRYKDNGPYAVRFTWASRISGHSGEWKVKSLSIQSFFLTVEAPLDPRQLLPGVRDFQLT
jgi:hypothetical protein